jgi:hypothetical protein
MPESQTYSILLWGSMGVAVIGIVLILLLPSNASAYGLPLLMIFGVIILLGSLTIAGKIFSETNLSCREEALGLPSGSVRALIALSLIIIFAIMAIFLYDKLSPTQSVLSIPANQTILYPNGTMLQNPNGTVLVTEQTSDAQREFSVQTLATVSTLVVALAGFYFGTKAVETARGVEKEPESGESLTLTPEGEIEYEKDKLITFKVETKPKGENFKFTVDGDKREAVQIGDTSNELKYTPIERFKNVVTFTFMLAGKTEVNKKLVVVFEKLEITPKQTGKLKQGETLTGEVKTTPKNAKVTTDVVGDKRDTLKVDKGSFTYSPSLKNQGRTGSVTLTFEIDGKPAITRHLAVDFED